MSKTAEKMKIVESAFYGVINHIGSQAAESGGALFGYEDDYVITKFVPDVNAQTSRSTYTINTDYLNPVIKRLWEKEGLALLGIVHSHPHGYASLSAPDMHYFRTLLGSMSRDKFYAPVVFTVPDGGFRLIPHILSPDGKSSRTGIVELIPEEDAETTNAFEVQDEKSQVSAKGIFAQMLEIEILMLKIMCIAWCGWLLIRLSNPVMTYLVKFLDHGTK